MENKNIKIIVLIVAAVLIFAGMYLFAAHQIGRKASVNEADQSKPNGARLLSQNGNELKLKLIFNNENIKSAAGVRYAVLLYKTDEKGNALGESPMDVKAYADNVILGRDNKKYIEKDVIYMAPRYLKGKYKVDIDYLDEAGGRIGSYVAGDVDLSGGDNNFLEILPETCFLQVEGNENSLILTQGIDVKKEENLLITCSVKNSSNEEIAATPSFENFYRNYRLNEKVDQEKTSFGPVLFKAGEVKNVSLPITKALKPQAYDAALYLADASNKQISNKAYAHYIIVGEGATIQNVTLDNNNYAPGGVANITVYYSGSSDDFDFSRFGGTKNMNLTMDIDIADSGNASCISGKKNFNLDVKEISVNKSISVTNDCRNPSVTVAIRGNDGQILDTRTFLRSIR
ncbi:MAG: hypothetical protein WC022_04360 [Parcubacteria group bacterium]